MFHLHVWLYTTRVPSAHRGWKKASDPLGLELRIVVNLLWVLRIDLRSSVRTASTEPLSYLSSPGLFVCMKSEDSFMFSASDLWMSFQPFPPVLSNACFIHVALHEFWDLNSGPYARITSTWWPHPQRNPNAKCTCQVRAPTGRTVGK